MSYTIYTSTGNPESGFAKGLMASNGVEFDEVKVPALKTDEQEALLQGVARTRYLNARRSFSQVCNALGEPVQVPLIVVTGTVIGGYPELVDWLNEGKHTHSAEFLARQGFLGQRRADNPRPGYKRPPSMPPRMSDRELPKSR